MVGVQGQTGPAVLPVVVVKLPMVSNPVPVVAQPEPVEPRPPVPIVDFESFGVYPELFLPL